MKRKIPIHLQYLFECSIDGLYDEYRKATYSKELKKALEKVKKQATRELIACGYRMPFSFHISIEDNYAVVSGTAEAVNPMQGDTGFRYTQPIHAHVS